MILQYRHIGFGSLHKLTIRAIGYPKSFAEIPEEAILVVCYIAISFGIIRPSTASVRSRPCLFQKISGIGTQTPVMTIGTDFSIRVKVIE